MQLFTKKKCIDILDEYLLPNSLRIKVFAICNLEKIQNQYFVREKSLRKIYYYYREIGIKNTFIKILSRWREHIRNEKYFSIGVGKILESTSTDFQTEQMVYFITYNHPACPERVVIHEEWAFSSNIQDHPWISENHIIWQQKYNMEKWWDNFLGWSPFSGSVIPDFNIISASKKIKEFFISSSIHPKECIRLKKITVPVETRSEKKKINALSQQKMAVLFGYGNYAKTMILPNLHKKIVVKVIHEIDPTQLLPLNKKIYYHTSPYSDDLKYDVFLIAGYHHTHADIAIAGLKSGADTVVEKPLMTTKQDLGKLILAMKNSSSELYACFQRRYHCFNDYVYKDFNIKKGDPISYYAIIYEESLPELHWYRWPNSRSAIVSNGCHWIDHFLFLNNFSNVFSSFVQKTQNNEIIVIVELCNGASLTLTLSHLGSARIGMQEYIELRSGNCTAKIYNGNYYESENNNRIIRKSRVNKYLSYKKMYQAITKNIVNKNDVRLSDTWEKVEMVSSLILSLDEELMHEKNTY